MATRGGKRKPATAMQPTGGRLEPPDYLSAEEREEFGRLRDLLEREGLASAAHVDTVAAASIRLVEIDKLSESIRAHGPVYETTNTRGDIALKGNPAVPMRSDALRQLQSLLAELGLTPTSVAKATPPAKPKEENKFARFARKQ